MNDLLDNVIKNADVSRLLCVAIATEAVKMNISDLSYKDISRAFRSIVRSLQRKPFTEECRLLVRLGPADYLRQISRQLNR